MLGYFMMSESKLLKGRSGLSDKDLHADADGGVVLTQKYLASMGSPQMNFLEKLGILSQPGRPTKRWDTQN